MRNRHLTLTAIVALAALAAGACNSGNDSPGAAPQPAAGDATTTTIVDWWELCGALDASVAAAGIDASSTLFGTEGKLSMSRSLIAELVAAAPDTIVEPLEDLEAAFDTPVDADRSGLVALAAAAATGTYELTDLGTVDSAFNSECGTRLVGATAAEISELTTPRKAGRRTVVDPSNFLGRNLCESGSARRTPLEATELLYECGDHSVVRVDWQDPEILGSFSLPSGGQDTVVDAFSRRIYTHVIDTTPASGLEPETRQHSLAAYDIDNGREVFTYTPDRPSDANENDPEFSFVVPARSGTVAISAIWDAPTDAERYGSHHTSVGLSADGQVLWSEPGRSVRGDVSSGPFPHLVSPNSEGRAVIHPLTGEQLFHTGAVDPDIYRVQPGACSHLGVANFDGNIDMPLRVVWDGTQIIATPFEFNFSGREIGDGVEHVFSDGWLIRDVRFSSPSSYTYIGADGTPRWVIDRETVRSTYQLGGWLIVDNEAGEWLRIDLATGEVAETLDEGTFPSNADYWVYPNGFLAADGNELWFIDADPNCDPVFGEPAVAQDTPDPAVTGS